MAYNLLPFINKLSQVRIFGIILVIVGIALLVFRGFNLQTEEKIIDAGPLEVTKKEDKWIGWPVYTGGIAIIAGLVMIVADRKKVSN